MVRGPKGVEGMKPPPGLLVPESLGTLIDSPPGAEFLGGPKWKAVAGVFGKLNAGG